MIDQGNTFHLQFPEDIEPAILHEAEVLDLSQDTIMAQAKESFLALEIGLPVTVYYQLRKIFVQQAAKITAIHHGDHPTFALALLGKTTSVENRQCYRVSTTLTELTCVFNDKPNCPILDVSLTGFAVISRDDLQVGSRIEAGLKDLKGREYQGQCVIRSQTPLDEGFRYGIECDDQRLDGNTLQRAVSSLSMSLQRQELRQLAGTLG